MLIVVCVVEQDVTLKTELTNSVTTDGFKTTLSYERQTFVVEGQLNDESSRSGYKKSASFRLAHPNSFTDIQLSGGLEQSDEKMSAIVETKYMMTRDRQMKVNSIRGEVDLVRKELVVEVTARNTFDGLCVCVCVCVCMCVCYTFHCFENK